MRTTALALIVGYALTGPAVAADPVKVGDVVIHEPWARVSIGNAPNSAAYMTLETMGDAADSLVSGATPAAETVELHTHIMEEGVAKMRPVEAIEVAPGTPTVLEPGGLHVMLIDLTGPLEEGSTIALTLEFETAGEVTLDVPVRGMSGSTGHGMDHGGTSEAEEHETTH